MLIATEDHTEWDRSFVALGLVDEGLEVLVEMLGLETEVFTHPQYKTEMNMLILKVPFEIEPDDEIK